MTAALFLIGVGVLMALAAAVITAAGMRRSLEQIVQDQQDILEGLRGLAEGDEDMALNIDQLKAQVQANTDAEASAAQALKAWADAFAAASGDQAAVDDLVAKMKASADSLASAVVANTPAAPQPAAG